MKNKVLSLFTLLVMAVTVIPVASAKDEIKPRLQVVVETPTVFDLMRESDIADAMVNRLAEIFRRAGFDGRVDHLRHLDDASGAAPTLTLRLDRWERRVTGFVDCSFTAQLVTADGAVVNLGRFNGTSVDMGLPHRFTRTDTFIMAVDNALRDLHRDFLKLDAVPA
jgi:hypothetical protein